MVSGARAFSAQSPTQSLTLTRRLQHEFRITASIWAITCVRKGAAFLAACPPSCTSWRQRRSGRQQRQAGPRIRQEFLGQPATTCPGPHLQGPNLIELTLSTAAPELLLAFLPSCRPAVRPPCPEDAVASEHAALVLVGGMRMRSTTNRAAGLCALNLHAGMPLSVDWMVKYYPPMDGCSLLFDNRMRV